MNRIDRLFGMLTHLQSKKYVQAEQLVEKFGISVRTVYRDIKALCEQGVPVSFEPGKGYFVVQGYFLPPVSFSTEEANAMLLMEAMVQGFTDRSISTHYSSALNKVKAVLKGAQKDIVEIMGQHIRLQLPACINNEFEYLSLMQLAITGKIQLDLEYQNNKGEISKRQVEPIGLIFYAFGWHLIAWCHLRNEYRDFRVSRVMKVLNAGKPFSRNDHMPLAEYMKMLPVDY